MPEWVVVLEVMAVVPPGPGDMQHLLLELADFDPVGMAAADRYALQVRVLTGHPEQALATVIARWRIATERLLLGHATVLRAEVMTPAELKRDMESFTEGRDLATTIARLHDEPLVSPDRVVPHVLSVLAGGDPEQVARAARLRPLQLIRWCDLFVEGGRLRLAGMLSPRSERDFRFFDMLADQCRHALEDLSQHTRHLDGAVPDGTDGTPASVQITSGLAQLGEYLDDLTEAVAASRRELPLRVSKVDLAGLVAEVLSTVDDSQVMFRPGAEIALLTDAQVRRRAMRHLVCGALEVAAGTLVQVSVRDQDRFAAVEARVHAPSPCPQALRTLFEPFGQQEASGRRGLGLFPCRALAVALHGDVGVAGDEEEMTFWLRVPRRSLFDEPGEKTMRYTIDCGDVMAGCPVRLEADTVDELLGTVVGHARDAHGVAEVSRELERQVRDAVREEEAG